MRRSALFLLLVSAATAMAEDCFDDGGVRGGRKLLYTNDLGTYCGFDWNTDPASDLTCSSCVADSEITPSYSGVGSCSASQWVRAAARNATPTCSQPGFSDLSGSASASQLPNPTASAKGGVSGTGSSLTCSAGQFVSGLTASGQIICTTAAVGTLTATPAGLSRALNTNFTPSTTKLTLGVYTVSFSCSISLTTGQAGTVELRSDTNATPTTGMGSVATGNTGTLTIGLAIVNSNTLQLTALIPANYNVRLVSSGTCTVTSVSAQETGLSVN